MQETIIEVKSLTKKYGEFYANKDISLNIKKGGIYGLVGENGAGKTLCGESPAVGEKDGPAAAEILRKLHPPAMGRSGKLRSVYRHLPYLHRCGRGPARRSISRIIRQIR